MTLVPSAAWPPPPDLEFIENLVCAADVEGLIAIHGAPADEYDPEARQIFAAIQNLSAAELIVSNILPLLESIWRKSFAPDDSELALRRTALKGLAQQIARFFGPEAGSLTL